MTIDTDLRQSLDRLINECLIELGIDRNQLKENLNEIGRCLDQNTTWHAMVTSDGRICAGKLREQAICIIDPRIEQVDKQIELKMINEPIPHNRKMIPPSDNEGFIEIVKRTLNISEIR